MIQQGLEIKPLHSELNALTIRPPISSPHPPFPALTALAVLVARIGLLSHLQGPSRKIMRLLEETDAQTLVNGNDAIRLPISHEHIQYSPWREGGQVTLWKIL